MALASAAAALLKGSQTPLQQLLEDINFQRTKEMRQLLKDGGYSKCSSLMGIPFRMEAKA